MKSLRLLLVLALFFLGFSIVCAQVYTWTDENGVRHYGDAPPDDAENAKVMFPEYQYDESADKKRTEQGQQQLESLIKELDAEDAEAQAEERKRLEEAEQNKTPTQQELIEVEKQRLEARIAYLEEQPLEFFGSQKNKTVRIAYYRYRLQALLEDPDKYFKQPASFEGNVKTPADTPPPEDSGTDED
jgi:transposase